MSQLFSVAATLDVSDQQVIITRTAERLSDYLFPESSIYSYPAGFVAMKFFRISDGF
jgi:hypothetical protein